MSWTLLKRTLSAAHYHVTLFWIAIDDVLKLTLQKLAGYSDLDIDLEYQGQKGKRECFSHISFQAVPFQSFKNRFAWLKKMIKKNH